MTGARRQLAALGGFVLLTLAYVHPLVPRFLTHCLGHELDASLWMWWTWHFRYALDVQRANPFWTDMIYWPHGVNLLTNHGLFYSVAGYFLQPILGLTVTYNVLMLQTMILSGYGVFLIADEWGAGWGAAFVAGALYAFAPDTTVLINSGIGYDHLSRQVLPFFVWTLSRAVRLGRARDAAFAALALSWAWGCDFYFFLVCCLLIPVFFLALERPIALRIRPRGTTAFLKIVSRALEAALAADLVWLLLSLRGGQKEFHGRSSFRELAAYVAPYAGFWALLALRLATAWRVEARLNPDAARPKILAPYVMTAGWWTLLNLPLIATILILMHGGDYGSTSSPWRGGGNPTDIGWLIAPSAWNPFWGSLVKKLLHDTNPTGCLGFAPLCGAGWLWRTKPQDRWVKLWFAGAVFSVLLTLGPWLKVFGYHTYLPLPFYFVHLLPVFSNIQNGYRLDAFPMLFFALLFAAFLKETRRRAGPRWSPYLPALAFCALALEFAPTPFPLWQWHPRSAETATKRSSI